MNQVTEVILEAQALRRDAASRGHEYLCCNGQYAYSGTWEEVRNCDDFVGVNNVRVALSFARMVREYQCSQLTWKR